MANLNWINDDRPELYNSGGKVAKLGKWIVGICFYDGGSLKNDPHKYKATCCLPGIRPVLGKFLTLEEGIKKATTAIESWIKQAGLE